MLRSTTRRMAGIGALVGAAAAYRGATSVARQNSPFRRAWELHLQRTLDQLDACARRGGTRPFVYVALGDSAAQGLGASQLEEGYVPRIAAGLERALDRDVALVNLSLSGGTSESVLVTQIPQLEGIRVAGEPLRPDLVTLDVGGNDVGLSRLTNREFGSNLRRIADRLAQPAFLANIPTFRPLRSAPRAEELSELVRRAAVDSASTLVDIQSASLDMSLWTYMFAYHAKDMFHPNSAWYERWSQLFMDAICERLGLPEVDVAELPLWVPSHGLGI